MNADRVLARLARTESVLAREADGAQFGLYAGGDLRRRPRGRVTAATVRALLADGALEQVDERACVLTPAGRARVEREAAPPDEAWRGQHDELVDRTAVDCDGDLYLVRGLATGGAAARLSRLKDADGKTFFSAAEIAAAARLAQDWAQGEQGVLRGADWSAPPRGKVPRGAGAEIARGAAFDARARVEAALASLSPAAAALVKAACVEQAGLELIERRARWPARSAKIALKFALAQLAQFYRGA